MADKVHYAIIRIEKHTTHGTIAAMGHHMDRTRDTANAVAERIPLNRTWRADRGWIEWSAEPPVSGEHLTAFQARLDDFKRRGGKIQKNAVLAIEVFMGATHEAFYEPGFNLDEWLDAQIDYLSKRFGASNIVSVVLHLDEETPHVHAIVIPEIQRVENRGRGSQQRLVAPAPKPALAASQWVGGKKLLSELQTDYALAMARFGLVRGKERSGARHVPVSAYYAQGEALVKEVEHLRSVERTQFARISELEADVQDAQDHLRQSLEMINTKHAEVERLTADLADAYKSSTTQRMRGDRYELRAMTLEQELQVAQQLLETLAPDERAELERRAAVQQPALAGPGPT